MVIQEIVNRIASPRARLHHLLAQFLARRKLDARQLEKRARLPPGTIEALKLEGRPEPDPPLLRGLARVLEIRYPRLCELAGLVPLRDGHLGGKLIQFSTYRRSGVYSDEQEEVFESLLKELSQS